MIIITGGAGFIGSALTWALNERGSTDIVIVDEMDHEEKEHNLAPLRYEEFIGIEDFKIKLLGGEFDSRNVQAVFHLGANSSTTETNWKKLLQSNVEFTQHIIRWCTDRNIRCIYASSANIYGMGEQGFSDDHKLFDRFKTKTLYGQSKLLVDIWARDAGYLDQVVGLRYFNVFGPNEEHKEHMRSVISKHYEVLASSGSMDLFKSHRSDYKDGEQKRDFIYVKDAVAATLFFLDHLDAHGVFNIGTGKARTWNDVAQAMFAATAKPPQVNYVEMPESLKEGYQYFTQADISKLLKAGWTNEFTSLEDSIRDYIQNYLAPHKHLGE